MPEVGLAVFLTLFGAWEAPYCEGNRLHSQGRLLEADEKYQQSLAVLRMFGRRDPAYATVANNGGTLAEGLGRYEAAGQAFRDAAQVLQECGSRHDGERARAYTNLGSLEMRRGRFQESQLWLRQALSIQERIHSVALGHTYIALANLELLRRDAGAASTYLDNARSAMNRYGNENDDETSFLVTRCWQLTMSGSNEEAGRVCAVAHRAVRAEVGNDHSRMAVLELHRAQLAKQTGELDQAAESYRAAASIFAGLSGPQSAPYARAIMGLANVRRMQYQFPSALTLAERALRVFSSASDSSPLDRQAALQLVADLDRLQGNNAEAEQSIRQSMRLAEETMGPSSTAAADGMNTLAVILYSHSEKLDEAAALLERCLEIRTKQFGVWHLFLADPLSNLGFVRIAQHRNAEAARLFEKSLALRQEAVGIDHPSLAPILMGYAKALDGLGDKGQAKWARSLAVKLSASSRNPSRYVVAYGDLTHR